MTGGHVMGVLVSVDIMVEADTAEALTDERRRAAVGRLVDMMVNGGADDPLSAVMHAMSAEARAAGLTEAAIDEELVAYNSERRG